MSAPWIGTLALWALVPLLWAVVGRHDKGAKRGG